MIFCNMGKAKLVVLTCGFPLIFFHYLNLFSNHLPCLILAPCKSLQPPVYSLLEGQLFFIAGDETASCENFLCKSTGLRKLSEIQTKLNSADFKYHQMMLQSIFPDILKILFVLTHHPFVHPHRCSCSV